MSDNYSVWTILQTIFSVLVEVVFYWQLKLYAWWARKPLKSLLLENLGEARKFEEWEAAAFQIDELLGNDLWRQNPVSKYYDYRLIYERLQAIIEAREDDDLIGLVNLLRSGLVRNLGNITAPTLFNRACAGTKLLIEDYITQVALAIEHVVAYPTSPPGDGGLTSQGQLDLLHDTRQAFGRSALVLQGGSIFGLCHIGVVKALHLRGLLPRIIAGTATGALIAALVGVHGEDDLLEFLAGDGIDLSAFAYKAKRKQKERGSSVEDSSGWFATLIRRVKRFIKEGYFLDVRVLEECVRDNVGDLTFEEAYAKTKRVLNITIAPSGNGDMPTLLNYLTAPNVLIWSAAVASNTSSTPFYHPVTLLCKDATGTIHPWSSTSANSTPSTPAPSSPTRSRRPSNFLSPPPWIPITPPSSDPRDSPLSRIAELYNVNHFVVSQARPYVAPFLQSADGSTPAHSGSGAGSARTARPSTSTSILRRSLILPLLRLCTLEMQHRLRQLDSLNLLPTGLRRFLVDESIPGASLTLVPELSVSDFWGLWQRPTRKVVDAWILRGERSVWPAVAALKVRCAVEVELDRAYQAVRRRKPMDAVAPTGPPLASGSAATSEEGLQLRGAGEKRKRLRASSSSAQKGSMG